ncbi:MAG: gephyrin-like molybdotransferase Glp [Phototrophicaceae bacterium]
MNSSLSSVNAVLTYILERVPTLATETIPLDSCFNRVLAEPIIAPMDVPHFPSSSMDGYALRHDDLAQVETFQMIDDVTAGKVGTTPLRQGTVIRIMTGAPLPEGADTVIPVEDTNQTWHLHPESLSSTSIQFIHKTASQGANIRPRGENIQQGQRLIEANTRLLPQHIGVCASIGMTHLTVYCRPLIVIFSTGDELVELGSPLQHGQIYDSNLYMLAALVEQNGGEVKRIGVAQDSFESTLACFQEALRFNPTAIITTAGVSVGAKDYVKAVVEQIGQLNVWKVDIRPGKPFAFGSVQGIPFFGLPGNPVSAIVTFHVFVRPFLLTLQHLPNHSQLVEAIAGEDIVSDGRRTYSRVRLEMKDNMPYAYLTGTQSSGALFSMVLADGLLVIPEGQQKIEVGEKVHVQLLR